MFGQTRNLAAVYRYSFPYSIVTRSFPDPSVLNVAMQEKFEQVFLVIRSSLGTACCLTYSAAQDLGCCPGSMQAALELPWVVEVLSLCINIALGSVDVL